MTDCYSFHPGSLPLLVSVPHDGTQLPGEISALMSAAGRSLPDTDWHVARLYTFVKDLGASMIVANYSRYVVDLNRPADDSALYEGQLVTGLCPTQTFDGEAIYAGKIAMDVDNRIQTYWRPYHDKISEVIAGFRESHGYALLWDAHSISSRVPALFDGELRVLNLGTWDGRSCDQSLANALMRVARESRYDAVLNARFKGGYITRHYGDPEANVQAVQLEIAQRAYLNEATKVYDTVKASQLRDTLQGFIETFTKDAKTRL
jgi:N-formylglutamate amidohydrolase